MIALDTDILVRYLVDDDAGQARAARALMDELTPDSPGFVCREVLVELVRVLDRAYGFSRDRIASVVEDLCLSAQLRIEAFDDVVRAARGYGRGGARFSDRMVAAAARRAGAGALYTFDRRAARLENAVLAGAQDPPPPGDGSA